jgi:hypothetical protein
VPPGVGKHHKRRATIARSNSDPRRTYMPLFHFAPPRVIGIETRSCQLDDGEMALARSR